jgi:hypothetical protein
MIKVEELQFLYPNPQCFPGARENCYCVGGALVKEYMLTYPEVSDLILNPNFPERAELGNVLQCVNSKMNEEQALHFAQRIIDYNDEELYSLAWNVMDKALKYMSFKA